MSSSTTEVNNKLMISIANNLSGFEKHILNCCRAPEYELRSWIKKTLGRVGFSFIEDNYKTERVKRDKRYEKVHNLVAIRGNPNVCLVAHTDTCREHSEKSSSDSFGSVSEWTAYDKLVGYSTNREEFETAKKKAFASTDQVKEYRVDPVVKELSLGSKRRRVIQDRLNKFQVGGDDRLGVAINTWIALNTGYDVALYFPTDEEIGLKSAVACEIQELRQYDICVQVDRGNHTDELVIKIGGEILCTYEVATRLLGIAYDLGMPRTVVNGAGTDVAALKRRNWIKNCVNMTCGYHNSHGSDPDEYIDIAEAYRTMQFVSGIVKDYYLKGGD